MEPLELACKITYSQMKILFTTMGLQMEFFSVTKTNIFSRELLDAWILDVCSLGLKLREAFA